MVRLSRTGKPVPNTQSRDEDIDMKAKAEKSQKAWVRIVAVPGTTTLNTNKDVRVALESAYAAITICH